MTIGYSFNSTNRQITVSNWAQYLNSADDPGDGCSDQPYRLDTTAMQYFYPFMWVQRQSGASWVNYQVTPAAGYSRLTSYASFGTRLSGMVPAEMNYALYSPATPIGMWFSQGSNSCYMYFTDLSVAFNSLSPGNYRTQMIVFDRDLQSINVDDDDHILLWTNNWYQFSVAAPTPAPTLNFTAGSYNLQNNQSTTLSWTSTNATTCSATGAWSGSQPVNSGSPVPTTGNLTGPRSYTYSLTCTGVGGSVTRSLTINVAGPTNGACGVTLNSCAAGSFQDVTDSSTYYLWNCNGLNGGTNASCSIAKPVTGSCGSADYRQYIYTQSEPFPNGRRYCTAGTASPNPPANPVAGGRSTWTCVGGGGGGNVACEARRQLNNSCGPAAKNNTTNPPEYTPYDLTYSGLYCAAGSPVPVNPAFPVIGGSTNWQCNGVYGGTNATCIATRAQLKTYDLWIYENSCTGVASDALDIVPSDTLPINWRPDPNNISIKDINGKTLCYEVHQNCTSGVKILGREYRSYNCPVPTSLNIQPANIDMRSVSDQELVTSVICSDGSEVAVNRDANPGNTVTWGGAINAIKACSTGTDIIYLGGDIYNLRSGTSQVDCSGLVNGTIANYVANSFNWGPLTGNFNLLIRKDVFRITGDDCPNCGVKYMNATITVPLVQCGVTPPPVPTTSGRVRVRLNYHRNGRDVTLDWSVTNATVCTASNNRGIAQWTGGKNASGGSETISNLTRGTTYQFELECSNSTDDDRDVVRVRIN